MDKKTRLNPGWTFLFIALFLLVLTLGLCLGHVVSWSILWTALLPVLALTLFGCMMLRRNM